MQPSKVSSVYHIFFVNPISAPPLKLADDRINIVDCVDIFSLSFGYLHVMLRPSSDISGLKTPASAPCVAETG